jgi:hypothetical protein
LFQKNFDADGHGDRQQEAADVAFERLARTEPGNDLDPAKPAAGKVGADVAGPGDDDQEQDVVRAGVGVFGAGVQVVFPEADNQRQRQADIDHRDDRFSGDRGDVAFAHRQARRDGKDDGHADDDDAVILREEVTVGEESGSAGKEDRKLGGRRASRRGD